MSAAHPVTPLEDVLLAFSVDLAQDKATRAILEHYLKLYPQYAEDLIDLLSELRLPERERSNIAEDEAVFQQAWHDFAGTAPQPDVAGPSQDLFADFRGQKFVLLAKTLRIPRSVLIALRDRLVIASSIPAPFLARLTRAMQSTAQDLFTYLELPPIVAPAASYKSDEKPEAPTKVSFEQLLDNFGVTAAQKQDICTSTD